MNYAKKSALSALVLMSLVTALLGCDRGGRTAGQNLDHAIDKTGETLQDAGDALRSKR